MGAETAMKFLREYDYVKFGMSADWALGRYKKVCDTRTSKPDEWTFWSKVRPLLTIHLRIKLSMMGIL